MTISASQLATSTPSVLAPGGSNLVMNGLFLTANVRVPIGTVPVFSTQSAVAAYFGSQSAEAGIATYYFNGYDNSSMKPALMLFAQVPYTAAVGAYLRGASFGSAAFVAPAITSGTLSLIIDGQTFAATGINLSAATSYSAAAATVQTALQAAVPTAAVVTGSVSGTVLTVTAVASGALAPGEALAGTSFMPSTSIVTQLTGTTGGVGTYTVSVSQTVASTTITATPQIPTVTFDSVSASYIIASGSTGLTSTIGFATGTVATYMQLLAANGAVTSQGAAVASGTGISGAMTAIYAVNKNWAGFMTLFEPTTADKVLFAAWASPKPVWYAMWDTLTAAAAAGASDTTSAGYQVNQANYNGAVPIAADPALGLSPIYVAAFALGTGASVAYNRTAGRITLAYRTQAGLTPIVANDTVASNLIANGYNFYGSYGNAGNGFVCFQNGQISGSWKWWDSYTNQIWLNNNIQTSLINLMISLGNIPFNSVGYGFVKSALYSGSTLQAGSQPNSTPAVGPVAQAVAFGAIQPGVVLSANQIAEVNAQAGLAIDGTLHQQGWYIQCLDPGTTVRLARGSPIVNLWYMDGQSVQKINVSSVNVQ